MVGRGRPLSRLSELIARAHAGDGGAVLITGETGVGKSTLIEAAAGIAAQAGFRVLSCSGVEGETQIGLAGLHELLRVIIDRAEILPEQHRDVLFSVFGLGPRIAPDRLQLSAAVLGLLTALAAEQPLMMVLDDAHWMDQPTIGMIAFLVRRVTAAPIVMVVARRPDGAAALETLGLDEIVLERLTESQARSLVTRRHPGLANHLLRQVLDESEGNPLALIELAGAAASGRHDGAVSSLRARLERGHAAQLAALSPGAQDLLLLVAAAAGSVSVPELSAAAERMGLSLDGFAEAEKSGLVAVTGTSVSFRHPLIRSAVYRTAGLHRRVTTHQALAGTLAERGQSSQAAWHRAAATFGYDEPVARDLEDAAAGDSLRGLHGAAMRALERAAALTRDRAGQGRRLIGAAQAARLAGMTGDCRRLAARAAEVAPDAEILSGQAMILLALDLNSGTRTCEPDDLLALGRRFAGAGRRDMVLPMVTSAAFLCRCRAGSAELRDRISEALDALDVPNSGPQLVIAHAVLAPARHAPAVRPRLRAYAGDLTSLSPQLLSGLGTAAEALQDWTLAAGFFTAAAQRFEDGAALADAITVRPEVAFAFAVQGRLGEALAEAEPVRVAARDGDMLVAAAFADAVAVFARAWQGHPVPAAELIRADVDALRAWAAGLSALTRGEPAAAYGALCATARHPDVAAPAIADLVEAAAAVGQADAVRVALEDAERLAEGTRAPLIRSLVHRARAILGEDCEGNFRRALEVPGADSYPLQIARTSLVYGEWLRRANRAAEARAVLTTAATVFERAAAHPWLARAQRSLRTV
ncbi:ATP-binding protein [Actinoplanes sp. GCM10030250]|uniref:ATP-binding protein n=1 Tax=Actinoplanes sp. GCM10030250 TaxID=3273376 RepID=UPI00360A9FE6